MLETLHIQNYALIDDLEVDFQGGFNVLTGETGAGKSIIVGALNLVLGARATGEALRDGADRAKIDAVFRIKKPSRRLKAILDEHDIRLDGEELMLSRAISADGRSRAYVAGALVPLSVLSQIGDELVDLHGQHEHQSLLQADRQLDLLDGYGAAEEQAADLAASVAALRETERSIAELEADDRERTRRLEFLRYEVAEIDKADPQPGEEEDLRSRRNLITNAEQVFTLAGQAYTALYESDGAAAIDQIGAALAAVEELSRIDQRFAPLLDQLNGVRADLDDLCSELRAFTDAIEYDPEELDDLNRRLSLLGELKRKYGETIEAIRAYRDQSIQEIERFERRDELLAEQHARRDKLLAQAESAAAALSQKRRTAAAKLDKRVTAALQELGMQGAKFETRLDTVPLNKNGIDRIEFLLAANPGERVKPLRQVASGGEISRVMLAIKTVLAAADKIPTLIFDEIDAGVGGSVANKVAARLRELATSHQTICITHLPQIAAAADSHYYVAKSTAKNRTTTTVRCISDHERAEEIARLLDGSVTDLSLKHAQALLSASGAAYSK
ncbi:MAG: DNA repair protein RecN [Candidatus Hydrogenedentota bacterium]